MPKEAGVMARFHWRLANKDDQDYDVTLQLEPEYGQKAAIYSTNIKLPAKTVVAGYTNITLESISQINYNAALIHKGIRVAHDNIPFKAEPSHHSKILAAYLDDSREDTFPLSQMQKLPKITPEVRRKKPTAGTVNLFNNIMFRSDVSPTIWAEYSPYDCIILLRPDFSRYSADQLLAIRDYVNQGGHLVIATPEASMACANSILRDFLPWTPISTVIIDDLNLVSATYTHSPYAPQTQRDANGDLLPLITMPFLEALPTPDATVVTRIGGKPAHVFARRGRGTVQALAFAPYPLTLHDSSLIKPIWEPVIANMGYLPGSMRHDFIRPCNKALQQLQGYSIPPVSTIVIYLLVYIVILAVILGIAFSMRRQALGWGLSCIVSIIMTIVIFHSAKNIATSQDDYNATSLISSIWQGTNGAVNGTTSLLSRSDIRPSIETQTSQTFLRPQEVSANAEGGTALSATTLNITSKANTNILDRMSLQQNRPRAVQWLSSTNDYGHYYDDMPKLEITSEGLPSIADWNLPADLATATRAILSMPGGQRILEIKDGKVIGGSGHELGMEADTVFIEIVDFLKHSDCFAPTLVLVVPQHSNQGVPMTMTVAKDESFANFTYQMAMVPLTISTQLQPAKVSSDFFNMLIPVESGLRSYMENGAWRPINLTTGVATNNNYIDFKMIPEINCHKPQQITVHFEPLDHSGIIDFNINLVTNSGKPLPPTKVEGFKYIFDCAGQDVIESISNHIRLMVIADSKYGDSTTKTLTWEPLKLYVSLSNIDEPTAN